MSDDIIEQITAAVRARLTQTGELPPPDNSVHLNPVQAQLVAALEDYLNRARSGDLLSFVGCGLTAEDVLLMFDGAYAVDLYPHIGALTAITTRLAEIALDHEDNLKSA